MQVCRLCNLLHLLRAPGSCEAQCQHADPPVAAGDPSCHQSSSRCLRVSTAQACSKGIASGALNAEPNIWLPSRLQPEHWHVQPLKACAATHHLRRGPVVCQHASHYSAAHKARLETHSKRPPSCTHLHASCPARATPSASEPHNRHAAHPHMLRPVDTRHASTEAGLGAG